MRYLSLFSGIEAASAAWGSLGWECAAVSEIEPFPCAVLAYRYPNVPNLGDVTKITEAQIKALGHIDLVVFGSPCQDLSVAGQRRGLINERGDITRSGLFFTAINIFHWSGARFALWENVPGAFSSGKGRDFASVVSFMAGLDDVDVPPNGWGTEGAALGDNGLLEWSILDAQFQGLAQRRRRVFALLDTGDWASRPPILLEPESLRGDTAPRRETGESTTHDIAPCIGASGRGFERGGDTRGQDAVVAKPFAVANANSTVDEGQTPVISITHAETMPTMQTGSGNPSGHGARSGDTKEAYIVPVVTHALRGEGFDASEDGTGRGTPLVTVAFVQNTRDEVRLMNGDGSIVGALAAEAGMKQQCYVAYSIITANTGANGLGVTRELSATLDQAQPHAVAYAFQPRIARGDMGDVVSALNAQSGETGKGDAAPCVATAMSVRRLTPTECERLQGFPDGHTAVIYRNKPAADGPRYKALGNSMAVPVMRHIGIKIMEAVWHI